jgi:hypothetical protein
MDSALASTVGFDPLSRINERLALLRAWLSHDHADEPYWWARATTAPRVQAERVVLKDLATVLHIARATRRGRIHGTWFANLDEQRAWLAKREATLASLQEGKLP